LIPLFSNDVELKIELSSSSDAVLRAALALCASAHMGLGSVRTYFGSALSRPWLYSFEAGTMTTAMPSLRNVLYGELAPGRLPVA